MASPVKVDEGRVRGQREAGKKRSADAKTVELPRKISIPSPTPLIPGSIPRGAVALEPYRYPTAAPQLVSLNNPLTLYVIGDGTHMPLHAAQVVLPQPVNVDTNANNNGFKLLLSPPVSTTPVTPQVCIVASSTPKQTSKMQTQEQTRETQDSQQDGTRSREQVLRCYADFNEGPLDVDEHFRRSLKNVPGCEELLKEAAAKQEEKQVKNKATTKKTKDSKAKDLPHFDHSAVMPTPESVDDHFARALGADWAKLSKLKD